MQVIRSVVLVDDDRDDQEIFKSACEAIDQSLEVVGFDNGELALKILSAKDTHPDVIFLDLNMPRLNGVEVLEELKHSSQLKNIPVVIYSTFLDTRIRNKCSSLGAVEVMEKPNCFEALCAKLRDVFGLIP